MPWRVEIRELMLGTVVIDARLDSDEERLTLARGDENGGGDGVRIGAAIPSTLHSSLSGVYLKFQNLRRQQPVKMRRKMSPEIRPILQRTKGGLIVAVLVRRLAARLGYFSASISEHNMSFYLCLALHLFSKFVQQHF